MNKSDIQQFLESLKEPVLEAGTRIMEIRERGLSVETKSDSSPVTEADRAGEDIIVAAIEKLFPNLAIVAEERVEAGTIPDVNDQPFVLIDALDGTKEFIKNGDSFTVNIGLIINKTPVVGLVYVPAQKKLFSGEPEGAFLETNGQKNRLMVRPAHLPPAIVASKSHLNEETAAFLALYKGAETVQTGSSLKFCLLAEGKADLYPRFGPTMEWDTAAGHAVLAAAGGTVLNPDGTRFLYNKKDFRNGYFIALGDPSQRILSLES